MNTNPGILQCKNCWKWEHSILSCHSHISRYIKYNRVHLTKHHREKACCYQENKNSNRLVTIEGELYPHIFKLSSSQTVDLVSFYFTFYFYFYFILFFYFSFLEQLGLGLIDHVVTSVIIWWHSHKTDYETWKNLVEDSRTSDIIQHRYHMLASWTIHGGLG